MTTCVSDQVQIVSGYARAKATRIRGGAVVVITRPDGKQRRHVVNAARYLWLARLFNLAASGGCFTSGGFNCTLAVPLGECAQWMKRNRK
jgi:hypothetical protein